MLSHFEFAFSLPEKIITTFWSLQARQIILLWLKIQVLLLQQ